RVRCRVWSFRTWSRLGLPLLCLLRDRPFAVFSSLSLHDALPICRRGGSRQSAWAHVGPSRRRAVSWCPYASDTAAFPCSSRTDTDRKTTRLNSSHQIISYAVFCLKKKPNR